MWADFLWYLLSGIFIGFFAGFFGIGGGVIGIPLLFFLFQHEGMPKEFAMHVAIGTSLATVFVTGLSSLYLRYRIRGMIVFSVFKKIIGGLLLGSVIGVITSNFLSGLYLKRLFAVLMILIACQTLFNVRIKKVHNFPRQPIVFATTTFLGTISSMLGIGGSALLTPYLYWCGLSIHQAIATATACIIPAASIGTIGYLLSGLLNTKTGAPISFINWPAFCGLSIASVLITPLGVKLSHVISSEKLLRFFAAFLILVGIVLLLPI